MVTLWLVRRQPTGVQSALYNGAPFPRPAYDSGWRVLDQGAGEELTHNIGGNVDSYVVDLQCKTVSGDINKVVGISESVYLWDQLTTSTIHIYRGNSDVTAARIRIRIWMYN